MNSRFKNFLSFGLLLFAAFFCSESCTVKREQPQLPLISVEIDPSLLNFGDYSEASSSFFQSQQEEREYLDMKIKYRGNVSAHYPKKNFSIKLKTKTCLGQEYCHKKWKVNAEYIDKTLMRNKLSYDLFRMFSKENFAPKITFVELNLNQTYNGIYALTERVDEDMLEFTKGDTSAALFKGPPISQPPEKHAQNHEEFIAFSNWAEFYKPFSERAMKKVVDLCYYNQRFPKKSKMDKTAVVHEITAFIFNSSNKDFTNPEVFNQYFDLANIIDWHLLLLITNNGDGLKKNFYMYKQGRGQPYKFCPWDYDHSFGRDGDGEPNLDEIIDISTISLIERLVDLNAFNYREQLYSKFIRLKKEGVLTEQNIFEMIDANVAILSPHIAKNEDQWPVDEIKYFEDSSFEKEVSLMKEWVQLRLIKIEEHLNNLRS